MRPTGGMDDQRVGVRKLAKVINVLLPTSERLHWMSGAQPNHSPWVMGARCQGRKAAEAWSQTKLYCVESHECAEP